MARYINYNVDFSGVTPNDLMWGGVQYEDKAVKVRYHIDSNYLQFLGNNISFRIDFNSESAGYDPSESLIIDEENCVERAITKKFTQYAGKMVSTLVITKTFEDTTTAEIVQLPCTLYFTLSKRENQRIFNNLSACEEYIASLVTKADKSVEDAQKVLQDFYNILEQSENDHSEYVKKTDFADNSGKAGVLRVNNGYGIGSGRYDINSPITGDTMMIVTASNGEIRQRKNVFKPITPANIDYAVKVALTEPKTPWTEEEKNTFKKQVEINNSIVENFQIKDSYETYLPMTEELVKGKTYYLSYFAGEYPGWVRNGQLPQKTKNSISVTCGTVNVSGIDYTGFSVNFPAWADGGTLEIKVYRGDHGLKLKKNFSGTDVISIFK